MINRAPLSIKSFLIALLFATTTKGCPFRNNSGTNPCQTATCKQSSSSVQCRQTVNDHCKSTTAAPHATFVLHGEFVTTLGGATPISSSAASTLLHLTVSALVMRRLVKHFFGIFREAGAAKSSTDCTATLIRRIVIIGCGESI